MTDTLARGLLELRFAAGADRTTRLIAREQRFPLRTTVPLYLDPADPGMAFVYVQNPTGGVFPGDELVIRIVAEAGARVHVTTPAATKLYRGDGRPAAQRTEVVLAEGAYVEYVPEPLIPHAGALYEQELAVRVGEGAVFVGAETLAPGRLSHGESLAYERLRLATIVEDAGGHELAVDTLLLEPARCQPSRRGLLGPYPYLGSLLAVAPGTDEEALAGGLDAAVGRGNAVAAAGELPYRSGAFVRVLARSAPAVRATLAAAWAAARTRLLGAPPPRWRK